MGPESTPPVSTQRGEKERNKAEGAMGPDLFCSGGLDGRRLDVCLAAESQDATAAMGCLQTISWQMS